MSLNDAAAVYAGSAAAVAVYAGDVKVWPPAGPPPAFAGWDFAAGASDFYQHAGGSYFPAQWSAADGGFVSCLVAAAGVSASTDSVGLLSGPPGATALTNPEVAEEPHGRTTTALEAAGLVDGRQYTMRITYRVTGPAATGVGTNRFVRVHIEGVVGSLFPGAIDPGWVARDADVTVQEWAKGVDPDGQWHTFDLPPVLYRHPHPSNTDPRAWGCWRPSVSLTVNSGGSDVRTLDLGQIEFIEVTP